MLQNNKKFDLGPPPSPPSPVCTGFYWAPLPTRSSAQYAKHKNKPWRSETPLPYINQIARNIGRSESSIVLRCCKTTKSLTWARPPSPPSPVSTAFHWALAPARSGAQYVMHKKRPSTKPSATKLRRRFCSKPGLAQRN